MEGPGGTTDTSGWVESWRPPTGEHCWSRGLVRGRSMRFCACVPEYPNFISFRFSRASLRPALALRSGRCGSRQAQHRYKRWQAPCGAMAWPGWCLRDSLHTHRGASHPSSPASSWKLVGGSDEVLGGLLPQQGLLWEVLMGIRPDEPGSVLVWWQTFSPELGGYTAAVAALDAG